MSYQVSANDPPDLSQEVRRLFDDLARRRPERRAFISGECSPTLDVLETEHAVEIVADSVQFLGSRGDGELGGQPQYVPAGAAAGANEDFASTADDDIPF